MSYKFNLANTDEFFYSSKNKLNSIQLPNDFGYLINHKEIISQDISLFKGDLYSSCDISMSAESLAKSLCINIDLQGSMIYNDLLLKKETIHNANNTLIRYINGATGIFNIKENTHSKGIGIVIKDDFLQEHFFNNIKDKDRKSIEKNYKENITTNLKTSLSNARTLFLANEIYNSPFTGELNSLYLQSKVYEIIYNEFSSLVNNKKDINSPKINFSKADIDSLHKAKEIMMTSKEKVSIPQLARKVALNENKLKHGFKHLFNTSPYAVMLERRMYEAKKLLQTSDLNVTEIADVVGYKYLQSFTLAFKKYFGQSPSEIIKNRKYYFTNYNTP